MRIAVGRGRPDPAPALSPFRGLAVFATVSSVWPSRSYRVKIHIDTSNLSPAGSCYTVNIPVTPFENTDIKQLLLPDGKGEAWNGSVCWRHWNSHASKAAAWCVPRWCLGLQTDPSFSRFSLHLRAQSKDRLRREPPKVLEMPSIMMAPGRIGVVGGCFLRWVAG